MPEGNEHDPAELRWDLLDEFAQKAADGDFDQQSTATIYTSDGTLQNSLSLGMLAMMVDDLHARLEQLRADLNQ